MQRNKIIKDYRYDKTLSVMLDVFEAEIVDMGNKIINYRKKYVSVLNNFVSKIYNGISCGKENDLRQATAAYQLADNIADLRKNRLLIPFRLQPRF